MSKMMDEKQAFFYNYTDNKQINFVYGSSQMIEQLYDFMTDKSNTTNNSKWDNLTDTIFSKRSDFISSLRYYPLKISEYINSTYTNRKVEIFNFTDTGIIGDNLTTSNISGNNKDYRVWSTLILTRKYNNFLDFAPFTKISIYLPYLGWKELDTNKVYGTLELRVMIDFCTGGATFYLYNVTEEFIVTQYSTNIGFNIPLTTSNASEIEKNNIIRGLGIGASALGGIALAGSTGGLSLIGGAVSAGKSLASMVTQQQVSFNSNYSSSDISGIAGGVRPFISIMRPKIAYDNDTLYSEYYKNIGVLTMKYLKIGDISSGFIKVNDIHLSNLNDCTKVELEEIDTLLKNGVIL